MSVMWRESELARRESGRKRPWLPALQRSTDSPVVAQILYLQRTAGNAAVTELIEAQQREPTPQEASNADGSVGAVMDVGDALAVAPGSAPGEAREQGYDAENENRSHALF